MTVDTYSYTGADVDWTVPPGVYTIDFDVQGAAGASSDDTGGQGGRVQGTLAVTPGESLRIKVGGQGQQGTGAPFRSTSAYPDGGPGGYANTAAKYSCGGGGSSQILQGGTATANRQVVAGGGGGGMGDGRGIQGGGNGGGTTGQAGANADPSGGDPDATGGGGGTPSAGGAGGISGQGSANPGAAGTQTTGGSGSAQSSGLALTAGGGGGGGGYWGGGGGGQSNGGGFASGGGGGSSFAGANCTAVTHTQGYRAGNGQIILTYFAVAGIQTVNAV